MTPKQIISTIAVVALIMLLLAINYTAAHRPVVIKPVKDSLSFDTLHSRIP